MQYNPKLKKAMEEIKSILKKYDVGAVVVLHLPGSSEYFNRLNPSYSCVIQEGDNIRIRARAKEDFGGDYKARDIKIANTSNMLNLLGITAGSQALAITEVSQQFDKIVDADHTDLGHSSQTEQNN